MDWRLFPEYDAFLRAHAAQGFTASQIAERFTAAYHLPVTGDQVSGRLNRLKRQPAAGDTPMAQFEALVETERESAERRAYAREMASAVKQQARWEEFLDIARDALLRVNAPRVEPVVIPQGSGTPETMVVLVGDVHVGKLVDPSVVGETFGYSRPIFQQRLERLKDRVLRLFSLHSKTAPIDEIRIHFMGDGIDGVDMRRGHPHRVDIQTAVDQSLLLALSFETWLRELGAGLGVKVTVIWNYGNHGRVGEFGVNLPADNWDYVAGTFLQLALRDTDVRLVLPTQKYSITQLGPMRTYSSHGDGSVKGGDGFAGMPINGLARAISKDAGLHKQLFDLYLQAHWHTPQDIRTTTGRIVVNGAWDGGDDYSVNNLKAASEPIQLAFGVHPTKGFTWQSEIHLTPERRQPTPVQEV